MKTCTLLSSFSILVLGAQAAFGIVSVSQTFEVGEDTSDWGDDWVASGAFDQASPTFLSEELGGFQAAFGTTQAGQEAYRIFKNNTAGLDLVNSSYTMSMYVQIDFGDDPPDSGNFAIANGDYGAYAGQLRVDSTQSNGNIDWLASDGASFVDLGINLTFSTPYYVEFTFDPVAQTYDVEVSRVNMAGAVQETASASGLAFYDSNVINNGQYGKLLFHASGSAGYVDVQADNINIANVPEPSTVAWIAAVVVGVFFARRRRLS